MNSSCEVCGKGTPLITTGPFAGSRQMLDYCVYCSKDLCAACMTNGKCHGPMTGNAAPYKHKSSEQESEEEYAKEERP